jgi:ubiquitin-activating enzyme E1
MQHTFPKDQKNTEGTPFWTGQKRYPNTIDFDSHDHWTSQFIMATANILAFIANIPINRDLSSIQKQADSIMVEKFVPKSMEVSQQNPNNIEMKATNEEDALVHLIQVMKGQAPLNTKINVVEFEKDEDSNFHVDFMAATANLRARNYSITEADRFKIKMIAGKIIPAIATTTAMVVGAVGLEIYKVIQVLVVFSKNRLKI